MAESSEQTFAIIKPDAVRFRVIGEIIRVIERSGLFIDRIAMLQWSKAQAEAFYSEHDGKPFFEPLVAFMTGGPLICMRLSGPGAVELWRHLIGPTDPERAMFYSIRGRFGTKMPKNAVHGSDSPQSAARELGMVSEWAHWSGGGKEG